MKRRIYTLAMIALLLAAHSQLQAATHIPETMNYQGYLTDTSGNPITGTRNMTFNIYGLGPSLWNEPIPNVPIANGIFNVVLGLSAPIVLPFREKYWLGITVAPDVEMIPRHELTNAAYSMASRKVVYQEVLTVALDGGDYPSIIQALGAVASGPTGPPAQNNQFLIEVQAGTYTEPTFTIPDWVTIRGQGWDATALNVDQVIMTGQGRALESLRIIANLANSPIIDLTNADQCYVRECWIETTQTVMVINMTNATLCAVLDNYIMNLTAGPGLGIVVAGMNDSRIENNVINNQATLNVGSYGITDIGAAVIEGYILKNTIQYITNGTPGPGPSFGIGLAPGGTAQVSYNVFMHGVPAKDIVDQTTGNPPVWAGPPALNPHGIVNQDSTGALIPAF